MKVILFLLTFAIASTNANRLQPKDQERTKGYICDIQLGTYSLTKQQSKYTKSNLREMRSRTSLYARFTWLLMMKSLWWRPAWRSKYRISRRQYKSWDIIWRILRILCQPMYTWIMPGLPVIYHNSYQMPESWHMFAPLKSFQIPPF